MSNSANIIAVLSGDIIGSTNSKSPEITVVRHLVGHLSHLFGLVVAESEPIIAGPDFYSGDGWQLACLKPELALRCAVFIRSGLISKFGCDTRISIGLGDMGQVDVGEVSLSEGEAFTLSGRNLQSLKTYNDMSISLPDRAGELTDWTAVTTELCNEFIRGWTRRQAEVVSVACLKWGKTHEEIGEGLTPPVSKQAVTKVLSSAHWRPISKLIELFEKTNWKQLLTQEKQLLTTK